MSPGARKLALAPHVITSVGWFGAVAAFLALAVAGLSSADPELVRAAYGVRSLVTWSIIVPLAALSFGSGIVSSLGTRWGLFRYYWVVLKLVITLLATLVMLVHTALVDRLTGAAASPPELAGLGPLRLQMVVASAAALLVLLVLTLLSIYKPPGLTPYGERKAQEGRKPAPAADATA